MRWHDSGSVCVRHDSGAPQAMPWSTCPDLARLSLLVRGGGKRPAVLAALALVLVATCSLQPAPSPAVVRRLLTDVRVLTTMRTNNRIWTTRFHPIQSCGYSTACLWTSERICCSTRETKRNSNWRTSPSCMPRATITLGVTSRISRSCVWVCVGVRGCAWVCLQPLP